MQVAESMLRKPRTGMRDSMPGINPRQERMCAVANSLLPVLLPTISGRSLAVWFGLREECSYCPGGELSKRAAREPEEDQ